MSKLNYKYIDIIIFIFIIIFIIIRLYNTERTYIMYYYESLIYKTNIVGLPIPQNIMNNINNYISNIKNIDKYTFIDFGCGTGVILQNIHNLVKNVEGVELDDKLVKIAKLKLDNYHNVHIYNMDMIDYKFKDIDTILYLYEPLWLVKDKEKTLDIYNTVFNNMIRQIKNSNIIIIYCNGVLSKSLDIPFFNKYNLKLIKLIKFSRFVPFTNNILYILSN